MYAISYDSGDLKTECLEGSRSVGQSGSPKKSFSEYIELKEKR